VFDVTLMDYFSFRVSSLIQTILLDEIKEKYIQTTQNFGFIFVDIYTCMYVCNSRISGSYSLHVRL